MASDATTSDAFNPLTTGSLYYRDRRTYDLRAWVDLAAPEIESLGPKQYLAKLAETVEQQLARDFKRPGLVFDTDHTARTRRQVLDRYVQGGGQEVAFYLQDITAKNLRRVLRDSRPADNPARP